jgi:hypothetical protein
VPYIVTLYPESPFGDYSRLYIGSGLASGVCETNDRDEEDIKDVRGVSDVSVMKVDMFERHRNGFLEVLFPVFF